MSRLRQIVPLLIALSLLVLAIWAINRELKAYRLQDVVDSFTLISPKRKLEALGLTALGYLSMAGYDWLGVLYSGSSGPLVRIIRTAFVSHVLGNTIGFTIFSGTAIRYRYYAAGGLSGVTIAKIITFTHLAFWLGIFTIGGMVFILDPLKIPTNLKIPLTGVRTWGFVFLGIVVVYFLLITRQRQPIRWRGEEFPLPSINVSLGLIIFSFIDWALAAAVLYVLLPEKFPLGFPRFFGIYVLALTAGVISTVPGGLGVFETVILFLRPESVPAPAILGSLLAYRWVYFFLPLVVALVLILGYEWQHRAK